MKKVLIIEDSPTQGQVLRNDFEKRNFEVTLATTGFEAHRALKEQRPDLIILDYLLPDTNGIELCRYFKQDSLNRSVPIIMYSAENKLTHMVTAYEAGADYYVVKDEEGEKALILLADSVLMRFQARFRLSKSA